VPQYAPDDHLETYWKGKAPLDYSHEREWRVPKDLPFELSDVGFIIVDTYMDEDECLRRSRMISVARTSS
jgi:hypothetical protein